VVRRTCGVEEADLVVARDGHVVLGHDESIVRGEERGAARVPQFSDEVGGAALLLTLFRLPDELRPDQQRHTAGQLVRVHRVHVAVLPAAEAEAAASLGTPSRQSRAVPCPQSAAAAAVAGDARVTARVRRTAAGRRRRLAFQTVSHHLNNNEASL